MNRVNSWIRASSMVAVAVALVATAGCGLDKMEQPPLSGPSGLGLNVTMAASPDQLPRDGRSQSVVRLTARDAKGAPVTGVHFSLTFPVVSNVDGSVVGAPDGAGLSQSNVVTDSSGVATFAVTAPIPASTGNVINIDATTVGTNADNDPSRGPVPIFNRVAIQILPRNLAPAVAQFRFDPQAPMIGELVTFDASATADESSPCVTCTYGWDFGGDGTANGRVVTHTFGAAGTYLVTLNVTDSSGTKSVPLQKPVTVSAVGPPVANFTFSPSPALTGQTTTFDATPPTNSSVAANHRIVRYVWSWGDGSPDTSTASPTTQHTYAQPRTYPVTLTVTDDLGQSANVTKAVTVGNGLTASITQSPPNPVNLGQTVQYDGSGSSSSTGTRIVSYTFDFGDGTPPQSSPFATAKHEFAATGTYSVTLTITDEKGQTAFRTIQTQVQVLP